MQYLCSLMQHQKWMHCFMHIKLKILTLVFFFIFLSSCGKGDDKYDEYFDTYREIFIAREFTDDSLEANKKIDSILASKDLNEKEFRRLTFEMIKDREGFFTKLERIRDSIRSMRDSLTSQ